MSDHITTSILTVHRSSTNFVYQCLKSMFDSDESLPKVHLFVGSTDREYLDHYTDDARIQIIDMPVADWEAIRELTVHRRLMFNFWRTLCQLADSNDDLLLCEDDIIFSEYWYSSLLQIVEILKTTIGDRFALSLYSPHAWPQDSVILEYPKHMFWGAQCMFYSHSVVQELKDYVYVNGVSNYQIPSDLLIQRFCKERDVNLYTVAESLVQHIGTESTGVGFWHTSPSFVGDSNS
jgi:hypothetical protein